MSHVDATVQHPTRELNGAEALMGFLAWVTTRAQPVTFGAHYDAGVACRLFGQFADVNPCGHLGPDWPDCLTPMPDEGTALAVAAADGFEAELMRLLNYHSLEGESDTPDFILATYLAQCLEVFNTTMARREEWYGRPLPRDKMPSVIGVGVEESFVQDVPHG